MRQQAHDGLRMCLGAIESADQNYREINDGKRPFHFLGKIHMAWSIDQIDRCILPGNARFFGVDRNAMTAFLRICIHCGVFCVDAAHAADHAAVIQHGFDTGCLAGIYMCEYTNRDFFHRKDYTSAIKKGEPRC